MKKLPAAITSALLAATVGVAVALGSGGHPPAPAPSAGSSWANLPTAGSSWAGFGHGHLLGSILGGL